MRAIVKNKIEAFAEKMVVQEGKHKTSSASEELKIEAQSLITENRVKNAISKIGK